MMNRLQICFQIHLASLHGGLRRQQRRGAGRGLSWFTFQLNVITFCCYFDGF
jgi:hypothetical protein